MAVFRRTMRPSRGLFRPSYWQLAAAGLYTAVVVVADTTQAVLQPDQPLVQGYDEPPKLRGRFLHISDLHPDEFYKAHSSTEEGVACHRGKGPAGAYGAETSDCDSPISLINATFEWIAANLRDEVDFVIWTGDTARHDSDESIPRSPAQILGTNRMVADKFAQVFANPKDPGRVGIPVIPTLGNNDILPHNILLPGPNKWLQYYSDIWQAFIPEEQRHSFEFGGWFYVEVVPNRLAVFSLNTLYFFDRNAGVDDCAKPSEPGFKQMEWLRIQLALMRQRGMKAILMGHVPPARTDSKRNWDETCWQKYNLWLRQYRDVVAGSVYGHMNIDHFLLHDTSDLDILGSVESIPGDGGMAEGGLSIESTASYLQELRDGWSKLPGPASTLGGRRKRKGSRRKELGGKWAERYHLSLVSPSIVPNYFPTIRVVEYNTTGLDGVPLWRDSPGALSFPQLDDNLLLEELKREVDDDAAKKRKKHKNKKEKKPKDPNLVVPNPPTKSSPPGPAYSPQTFTLTGYTQYFANLTYINNDMTDGGDASSTKWRDGIHKDKAPKHKKPKPREFKFEVEYSTFTDKVYKLADLTVRSYVRLAYRMSQDSPKGKSLADGLDKELGADEDNDDDFNAGFEVEDYDDDDGIDVATSESTGKHGKKEKGKKKKRDEVWLHFLKHAFVSTVDTDVLKKV